MTTENKPWEEEFTEWYSAMSGKLTAGEIIAYFEDAIETTERRVRAEIKEEIEEYVLCNHHIKGTGKVVTDIIALPSLNK